MYIIGVDDRKTIVAMLEKILEGLRPVDYTTSGIHIHGLASIPQVTQLKGNRIFLYVELQRFKRERFF